MQICSKYHRFLHDSSPMACYLILTAFQVVLSDLNFDGNTWASTVTASEPLSLKALEQCGSNLLVSVCSRDLSFISVVQVILCDMLEAVKVSAMQIIFSLLFLSLHWKRKAGNVTLLPDEALTTELWNKFYRINLMPRKLCKSTSLAPVQQLQTDGNTLKYE